MIKIVMIDGSLIQVNEGEISTDDTKVTCVDADTREGLIIPLTSIFIIKDGGTYK